MTEYPPEEAKNDDLSGSARGSGRGDAQSITVENGTLSNVAQVRFEGQNTGTIIAAGGDVVKEPELHVVENWFRHVYRLANEYYSANLNHEEYL